ncbi:CHAT domain-containing protein [Agromyces sp. Soil535]|uniref:CHAT domain-containing protein n=1 Tax=Agromyces sp. Soil535 TaxID=1736390 RepID=UPI0006FA4D52|nr:CHAT domain-containing protein [Agromyces sp. Soil535]KRE30939.1 hypothetical protein ASG80_00025 [Agromyces sp. Soil535]
MVAVVMPSRQGSRVGAVMELEIGPGPEQDVFSVRVLHSVSGDEATGIIRLDLDELVARRPLVEATVLSSAVAARRILPATEAVLREVGERLFVATFDGAVGSAYRTSSAIAAERGADLQIALRITAPELATLPWESLFDPDAGVYLCRKEPLVRRVPAPHSPPALAVTPPLRILAMVASPRGLPMLDVEAERERLEDALRPELHDGRVYLEWLEEASWHAIHTKLLAGEWHVLHFVGHGTFDTEADEGLLAFVGQDGRADFVPANALADLLNEAEPSPRLGVLNSCQSGAASGSDLFSGTAAALAHSGIRAVAAMQFSISDAAAIAFARGFYASLAYGRGVDEAVRSGRIGILGLGRGTLEWVTPMLYLRGDDPYIFSISRTPNPTAAPAEPGLKRKPEPAPESEPVAEPKPAAEPVSAPEFAGAVKSVSRHLPLWKRPITWVASVLVGALGIAITNQLVPMFSGLFARVVEQGPAVRVVSVEPLPGHGEFAFERGTEISEEFLTELNALPESEFQPDWLFSHDAVKIGSPTTRIVLEGTQSEVPVRILDMQPEVECGDPLDGSVFTYPSAGSENAIRIDFDLDRPDAPGLYRSETGALEGPYFPNHTITLERAEQVVMLVSASTQQGDCKYRLRLDILGGDDRSSIVVPPRDADPLHVTAPLDHAAYEAVYLGGVDCYSVFRRASPTYFQEGYEPPCQEPPPGY